MAGGEHLTFSIFSENMKRLADPDKIVMECAVFLRESGVVNKKSWKVFSEQFFRYYRKTILSYYGYEEAEFQVPRRHVTKPFFFLSVMSALFKIGIFGCSLRGLVDTLYLSFDLEKSRSTDRRLFYDILPQYEIILSYFNDLKSTGKIEE